MDVPSIILLSLILLWILAAILHVARHGACGCGGKHCGKSCSGCCKNCRK